MSEMTGGQTGQLTPEQQQAEQADSQARLAASHQRQKQIADKPTWTWGDVASEVGPAAETVLGAPFRMVGRNLAAGAEPEITRMREEATEGVSKAIDTKYDELKARLEKDLPEIAGKAGQAAVNKATNGLFSEGGALGKLLEPGTIFPMLAMAAVAIMGGGALWGAGSSMTSGGGGGRYRGNY